MTNKEEKWTRREIMKMTEDNLSWTVGISVLISIVSVVVLWLIILGHIGNISTTHPTSDQILEEAGWEKVCVEHSWDSEPFYHDCWEHCNNPRLEINWQDCVNMCVDISQRECTRWEWLPSEQPGQQHSEISMDCYDIEKVES